MQFVNKETMHINNYQLVLKLLSESPQSRISLSKITKLTQPTIGNLTTLMLNDGIIQETGKQTEEISVGRKPILLSLNPSWGYIGCISIERKEISVGITDLSGKLVVSPKSFSNSSNVEECLNIACNTLKEFIAEHLPDSSRIIGVGAVAPGPLNSNKGIIINPPSFNSWHHVNLRNELEKRLPYPIYVEHNSTAITRVEKKTLSKNAYSNFAVYHFMNTGIGLGLVLNNTIFSGAEGIGCEIGHTSLDLNGRPCVCGRQGCLELYASTAAILHDASRINASISSWQQLIDRAIDDFDPFCNHLLDYQARYLAQSIINLTNLLTLDIVILAGQITYRGNILCEKITSQMHFNNLISYTKLPEITLSKETSNEALLGASALIQHAFFSKELFLESGLTI